MTTEFNLTSAALSGVGGYGIGYAVGSLIAPRMAMGAGAVVGGLVGYMDYQGQLNTNNQMMVRTVGTGAVGYYYPIQALGRWGTAALGGGVGYFIDPRILAWELGQ